MSYAAADCSGTGELSVQTVNTCGKDSSDPSPIDVSCSTTAALTPVITQPSSAFLPPPISGSGELLACTDKATRSSRGDDTLVCGNVEKYVFLAPVLRSTSVRAAAFALALAAPYTPALAFLSHRLQVR